MKLKNTKFRIYFLNFILLTFIISCEKEEKQIEPTVTFTYNGNEVTYGTIVYAGRVWMDRNLGASRIANSYNDTASFGDFFQWGREADGHQIKTSDTISTLALSGQQPKHDKFIITKNYYDWNSDENWTTRWLTKFGKKTYADPCPSGWRVPTKEEWQSAINSGQWNNYKDGFNSPLKLPAAGYRSHFGDFYYLYDFSLYWSSGHLGSSASILFLDDNYANTNLTGRVNGLCIRCIMEE
ncbi:MAG: FISUMP domain-containing protein [Bacteroidales bacterium]